jgi:hypothetical protein
VWLKDIGGDYMRGRAPGEIAEILRDELLRQGLPNAALVVCLEETRAARDALSWAQPGDVLVLPIHEPRRATMSWRCSTGCRRRIGTRDRPAGRVSSRTRWRSARMAATIARRRFDERIR